MKLGSIDVPAPTVVLGALALAVAVALVIAGTTSGAAFGTHNPGWEGLSEVQSAADAAGAEPIVATDVERYRTVDPEGTVALIVAPGEYAPEERERIRAFVEDGGTVVVAARDPATADPLLEGLGTDVRVDGDPLRDEREHGPTPDFPRVTSTANHAYVDGAEGMELNHGTALVVGGEARPLANSSGYAYLDRNGDGEPNDDEELSARPVAAVQPVGDGEVVAVSDPSVFINAMLETEGNRAFLRGLVADRDRLLVDRTGDGLPPLVAAVLAIRGSTGLSVAVAAALVGGVLAWERRLHGRVGARLRRRRDPPEPDADRDALAAYLADRHPDWDDERRERVLGGVMNAREQTERDE